MSNPEDDHEAFIRAFYAKEYPEVTGEYLERWVATHMRTHRIHMTRKTPLNYGTFPDPHAKIREWVCFSTAMAEGWLMLQCAATGAQGVVKDPTRHEWGWAFDCPSNPKPWRDASRVTLMKEGNL